MTSHVLAAMLAATFTAGCITIHDLRAHARALTTPLSVVAACMGVLVVLVGAVREQPIRGGGGGGGGAGNVASVAGSNASPPARPSAPTDLPTPRR